MQVPSFLEPSRHSVLFFWFDFSYKISMHMLVLGCFHAQVNTALSVSELSKSDNLHSWTLTSDLCSENFGYWLFIILLLHDAELPFFTTWCVLLNWLASLCANELNTIVEYLLSWETIVGEDRTRLYHLRALLQHECDHVIHIIA